MIQNNYVFFFFAIAGNKTDRDDREIPSEVGDEFAQRHGMYFLETSAKASDNVERLFTEIAHELLQVHEDAMPHRKKNLINNGLGEGDRDFVTAVLRP